MIVHQWGLTEYQQAVTKMYKIHQKAQVDKKNHLILTQHKECFTVGKDEWDKQWNVPIIKSDRGGSITSHSKGQNIYYFCFQTPSPPHFFTKIISSFKELFNQLDKNIEYKKENPGFYLQNRKLCSLGFRYKNGVSLHGVALNVDIDLNFHSQISPCNLNGIYTTSLANEDIHISCNEVNKIVISKLVKNFDESI